MELACQNVSIDSVLPSSSTVQLQALKISEKIFTLRAENGPPTSSKLSLSTMESVAEVTDVISFQKLIISLESVLLSSKIKSE